MASQRDSNSFTFLAKNSIRKISSPLPVARMSGHSFHRRKIFTIEAVHNHQNDRIWTSESALSDKLIIHSQHPQSVMVCAGICASIKKPLIFLDFGVKVNKDYYLREFFQRVLKPRFKSHFGRRVWIFQQDSATAHKAKEVKDWCNVNFPGFISAQE
uniref:Tc1-like transposase DDE domain-containing protein n=1 Tax=Meloidogyne incognita TaxID=6306 RepID=A0A914L9B9_MELIC